MSSNKDLQVRRLVSLTAFVAIVLIALSLLLQCLFGWFGWAPTVIPYIRAVGEWLSTIIACISAWFYVRTKRKTLWYVVYAIAVTVILILLILRPL